ncbi:MAG: hypothetical protein LBC85_06555 [Fibromonadaceae bacterium]|jgi:hypothetical protein|nr:hypothetical protein [Fibromonadaceae bacterium]
MPANVGLYTVQATFPQTENYASFQALANFEILGPKDLQVAWGAQRTFEYNKMVQSPTATARDGSTDISLHISGTQSAAGTHSIMAIITDETLRRRYTLLNNTADYEITKRPLRSYFRTNLPDFDFNSDTLWVPTEVFADSVALTRILNQIISYEGFATNTETSESDNAENSLKGTPSISLEYEVAAARSPMLLPRRTETTQKATAIISPEGFSADNYSLNIRHITVMETADLEGSAAERISCRRESYCTELSRAVCDFIDGTAEQSCAAFGISCLIGSRCVNGVHRDECAGIGGQATESCQAATPILQQSYGRDLSRPSPPLYYNLKGTPLGTQKPTTPGVYIEKRGKYMRKIAVR